MFKPVTSQPNIPLLEEDLLRSWKTHHIFQKSIERRKTGLEYVLFDEPFSAHQPPGINPLVELAFKDVFIRYRMMRGYHAIRRLGWNAHGLPVELIAEKHLGFTKKAHIEAYSIRRFDDLCQKLAFDYALVWERLVERSGSWVDIRDAYDTSSNEYIESVWWALKTLWDKGLLYQEEKFVHFCPHCGTPLSDHIAELGLAETVNMGAFVRFPLTEDPGTSLLVWVTTPWTLPGNVAIAANPDMEYVIIERDLSDSEAGTNQRVEKLILAKALVGMVFQGETVRVYETFKGIKLKGLRYQPLFTFLLPDKPSYHIILTDSVLENGTGLRQVAPLCGAEDMQYAKEFNLPVLQALSTDGTFITEIRPWGGQFVNQAEPLIIQDLQARGLVYRTEAYKHNVPFCWYCGNALLNLAHRSWYIRLSQFKDQLLISPQGAQQHVETSDKSTGDELTRSSDWLIGINRYWGTPIPIWECGQCQHQLVIGSVDELAQLAGRDLSGLDLHRPALDEVQFPCPECSYPMKRLPEVLDAWFDLGCAPFAQKHYPFEKTDTDGQQVPIDLIFASPDKTDLGFFSLRVINTVLFDTLEIKKIYPLENVPGSRLQVLAKSHGEALDPLSSLSEYGADTLRWYFYTTNLVSTGTDEQGFSNDRVAEDSLNFVLTLWNVYEFFVTHANQDQWMPLSILQPLSQFWGRDDSLDRWLHSRMQAVGRAVTDALENYNVLGASRVIQEFVVDDLSRWYLHHSMGVFGSDTPDNEKTAFYATLYDTLVTLSRLLAPFTPFLAEELYLNLVLTVDPQAPASVHLTDWPMPEDTHLDEGYLGNIALVKKLANLGHTARDQAAVKPQQPLADMTFIVPNREEAQIATRLSWLLASELNVKQVRVQVSGDEAIKDAEEQAGYMISSQGPYSVILMTALTEDLIQEGLAREFVQRVRDFRSKTDLDPADLIRLSVSATSGLMRAIETYREFILRETKAVEIQQISLPADQENEESMRGLFTIAAFNGERVTFGLEKVG